MHEVEFQPPKYLFSRFFEGKAIEHLIGPGVKSSELNDDQLGRVMDKLYAAGINFCRSSFRGIEKIRY